jgi:WD40 repeat protein/O-acetyl-ADP-ribose deacetylase (regulator of RNase III)/CheY-like chemotaxis protein
MSDDNYYKVGGSLEYQHPTYVRRKADSDLYEGLKNGEFCYVLNSRQMGKSSLRVQMMKQLKEQGFKCASIDMTRIGSHVTPAEWYAGVVSELLRGFGLAKKVNFSSWWRDREMLPPLQRLSELIEDVLLAEFSQKLVIFIDEIDSIIKIKFKEDFFAFIRACYNQRVDNPEYNRLTFCLLGVATPSDLIEDRNLSTPFNIGRAIELTGFQLHEATPLAQGLTGKTSDSQALMREVLEWTGGQPFLTQKVCKLILNAEGMIPDGNEAVWVENLVREAKLSTLVESRLIENWETQDEPEHLRTIRDRILWSPHKGQLLQLYHQILQSSPSPPYQGGDGGVKAKDTPEHMELRLSGLVVKQQGKLRVYNRIYESVFNQSWVENALAEAGLLPKVAETPTPSKAEIQALEQAGVRALQLFASREIVALVSAMQAGLRLQTLVSDGRPLQDYAAINPLLALHTILDNIHEQNYFRSHQKSVYDVCFSPDGRQIATAGDDGTVKLWNLFGQQLAGWKGHQGIVYDVCFSPDGQQIATAGRDGVARLWNLAGQQIAQFDGHQPWALSVSFSFDGQQIATAGADGTVRLWNLSGQQIAQFHGHQGSVWSVSFSPDGQQIATAGDDGTARLWNLLGQQIAQFHGHQSEVWYVSFSPNGQLIATAGADGTARVWSLLGQQLAQFNGHQNWVRSVIFSPNGQCLATAGYDGTARLWSLSGQQVAQFNGHIGAILGMSFSCDGQRLVTAGGDDTVRLWDLSEKHLAQWNAHQGTVYCVTFTLSQKYIFTTGADGTIRLWDRSGQLLAQMDDPNGWIRSASFSPGMHYLVTAGADGKVRLWRVTWQLSNTDLQSIITSSDRKSRLWEIKNLHDGNLGNCDYQTTFWYEFQYSTWVNSVNFSPSWLGVDTERIATAGVDGTVCIWNLTGHQLAQWNTNQGELQTVSFHPDGQRIASAGVDGTVCLWDLSGHNLADWRTHQGKVTSVTFSPDGQIVATGGEDGTVKLWTISGHLLAEIKGYQGCVTNVSFCDSGKLIATACDEGTVQLWRVEELDELLARGCDWLKDYFATHAEALEKLEVCQNRFKSIEAGKNLASTVDVEEALSDRTATPKEQTTSLSQQDEVQAIANFQRSAQTSNTTNKHILWVDDKAANIADEIARLHEKGIGVTEARSTAQAMQILVSSGLSFNAIISDMSRIEEGEYRSSAGISLIKAVREAGIHLPILIYTTLDLNARTINEVVAAGGNGAMMSAEELLAWLRDYTNSVQADDRESDRAKPQKLSKPTAVPIEGARQRLVTTVFQEPGEGFLGEFLVHEKLVRIYQGDITNLATDVIVSSDDSYLTMGGGVSYSIRKTGGDEIYREAKNLIPLSLGEVAVTTAGQLRAKKVFHAVVIDFYDRKGPSEDVIQQVVHACMKKASGYNFRSIAFPLLGTGSGGFSAKLAWEIILRQIIRDLSDEKQKVVEVILVIYGRRIAKILNIKTVL